MPITVAVRFTGLINLNKFTRCKDPLLLSRDFVILRYSCPSMASSPEQLFESLNSSTGILALIGGTEDLHLDCKVWPTKDEEAQRMIAKAACASQTAMAE